MGTSALIVARPGPMRDGLSALVTAMPQIDAVQEADDTPSALMMGFEDWPAVVVMESGPGVGDVCITTGRMRARWPTARLIFLVNDVQQQREAEAAGADVVLMEGFPAGKFVAAIMRLLPEPLT